MFAGLYNTFRFAVSPLSPGHPIEPCIQFSHKILMSNRTGVLGQLSVDIKETHISHVKRQRDICHVHPIVRQIRQPVKSVLSGYRLFYVYIFF